MDWDFVFWCSSFGCAAVARRAASCGFPGSFGNERVLPRRRVGRLSAYDGQLAGHAEIARFALWLATPRWPVWQGIGVHARRVRPRRQGCGRQNEGAHESRESAPPPQVAAPQTPVAASPEASKTTKLSPRPRRCAERQAQERVPPPPPARARPPGPPPSPGSRPASGRRSPPCSDHSPPEPSRR